MRALIFLRRFLSECKAGAAIEFAFIAPVFVIVAVGTLEGGLVTYHYYDMQSAVSSGAQYVMRGGTDTAVTQAVVQSAWTTRTDTGQINISQLCRCGTTVYACAGICPDTSSPRGYTSISASDNYKGLFVSKTISASETIRVR